MILKACEGDCSQNKEDRNESEKDSSKISEKDDKNEKSKNKN